jgi:hypothetical protein
VLIFTWLPDGLRRGFSVYLFAGNRRAFGHATFVLWREVLQEDYFSFTRRVGRKMPARGEPEGVNEEKSIFIAVLSSVGRSSPTPGSTLQCAFRRAVNQIE